MTNTQFDLLEFHRELKDATASLIVGNQPIPSRMDLFRMGKQLCTITAPKTPQEQIEKAWSGLMFAPSLFGATHAVFSHKADISVSSPLIQDPVPTPCLCVYYTSMVQVNQAIFPYVYSMDDGNVIWQEEVQDFDAFKEYPPLTVFLSLASAFTSSIGNPQRYLTWLTNRDYTVQFYEPFDKRNFALFAAMFA